MNIANATSKTTSLDSIERSKYNFRSLANTVEKTDNHELLVSTSELKRAGFTVEPFWDTPGDIEGSCYLPYIAQHPSFELSVRQTVFEMLREAQRLLPSEWQIVLKAGYRPFDVQVSVLEIFMDESRKRFTDWTEAQHLTHARTFVADPTIVCPPHVTGGAVDLDIQNQVTGQRVDMGCPPNTDSEISFLHSDLLLPEQYKNRLTLLRAMLGAGFAPNPNEWWHYQYGETYWAAFYGQTTTKYDVIKV